MAIASVSAGKHRRSGSGFLGKADSSGGVKAGRRLSDAYQFKARALLQFDQFAQQSDLAERQALRRIVEKQREQRTGCMAIPWTLTYFLVYAFAANLHEDVTNVFLVESSVRSRIEDGISNLESIQDLWQWLRSDFVDTFFNQYDEFGDLLPEDDWSRVLMYNQVTGAITLKQYRSTTEPCGTDESATRHMMCYNQKKFSREAFGKTLTQTMADRTAQTRSWAASPRLQLTNSTNDGFEPYPSNRRLRSMRPELALLRAVPAAPSSGADRDNLFQFNLYPTDTMETVRAHLWYLEERAWLDERTVEMSIDVMLLNAELGRPRLENLQLSFSFSRGGGIYYKFTFMPLFLEMWYNWRTQAIDAFFVMMLGINTISRVIVLWHSFSGSRLGSHLRSLWTFVEWVIILLGWITIMSWFFLLGQISALRDKYEVVRDIGANSTLDGRLQKYEDLQDQAHEMQSFVSQAQIATSWYLILLMLRFFTAYSAQPRLAVVTRTLRAVVVDIGHFLVVFLPTFFAYAIAGNIVFGRRMSEFSTLLSSTGQCFRILIENEYQWQKLSAEHYWTAAMWVWSFLLLVVLLMLNMVLAIVLDVYNQIRQDASSSETLVKSLGQLATRAALMRFWVPDGEIEAQMKHHKANSVTKNQMHGYFPNMPVQQANMLFEACKEDMKTRANTAIESTEAMKLMASIKFSVDKINRGIAARVHAHKEGLPWPPPVGQNRPSILGVQLSNMWEARGSTDDLDAAMSVLYGAESSPAAQATGDGEAKPVDLPAAQPEETKARPSGVIRPPVLQPLERPFAGLACPPGGSMPRCLAELPKRLEGATDGMGFHEVNKNRPQWSQEVMNIVNLQNEWLLSLQSVLMQVRWHWHASLKVANVPSCLELPRKPI